MRLHLRSITLFCEANLGNPGLRACFKIGRGPAARDFGRGQGGEFRASPQRPVRNEPTQATGKRPAARRVFGQKAVWLRCSSVTDRCGYAGARAEAPRRASPSGLLPENRPPANFKTGSYGAGGFTASSRIRPGSEYDAMLLVGREYSQL